MLFFFVNCGILKSLLECLGPKDVFLTSVLEHCHAEHTTFKMCRHNVLTFVVFQLGYITFCLSRGCDLTLLKYHAMKIKL